MSLLKKTRSTELSHHSSVTFQCFLLLFVLTAVLLIGACSGGGGSSGGGDDDDGDDGGGGGSASVTTYQMGGAIQGEELALTTEVTTFAGATDLSLDGTGTVATFNDPSKVATDGTNLYVVDTASHKIRKVVIATGEVITLAGSGLAGLVNATGTSALFNNPQGITIDSTYTYLYVADTNNHNIRRIDIASGAVTSIAGSSSALPGSTDATGASASFSSPRGITTDDTNLYVADTGNNKIRKILISSGAVTSLAGGGVSGIESGSANGTGTGEFGSYFDAPYGITNDGTNLYVADTNNNLIRQVVISSAVVTTLAGSGLAAAVDATGTAASFNHPNDITRDGDNLYVADTLNHKIRQIVISTTVVSTLAGSGDSGWTDSSGAAASFHYPGGVTTDGTNVYVVDTDNQEIRQIVISGAVVSSIAGSAALNATGTVARFNIPYHVTTDGTNLYLADYGNNIVRRIEIASGAVTTLAGSGAMGATDGTGTAATFSSLYGVTTDGTYLYVTGGNKIRQIEIDTAIVTTLAGSGSWASGDGTGTAATFANPYGITTDGTYLYVVDTGTSSIRKVDISSTEVTTIAGTGSPGSTDATGTAASFNRPYGITTDGTNLYVADTFNSTIRQIVISSGEVTTLAGTAGSMGSTDATGTAATFFYPHGITTDGTNLYVADTNSRSIRKIVIGSTVVSTLAGGSYGSTDGTGTAAKFCAPFSITTDSSSLYVTDQTLDNVRQIE